MNRERPIQVSFACGFLIFIHLFPTAPLMHHVFQLAREFSQGGMDQMYSAYKATVKPETITLLVRLSLAYIGLFGVWGMRRWGIFMLTAGVAWSLWINFQASYFTLLNFKLPIISLLAIYYYSFRKPVKKVTKPDVHYYSAGGSSSKTDGKGADESADKSALEELLY